MNLNVQYKCILRHVKWNAREARMSRSLFVVTEETLLFCFKLCGAHSYEFDNFVFDSAWFRRTKQISLDYKHRIADKCFLNLYTCLLLFMWKCTVTVRIQHLTLSRLIGQNCVSCLFSSFIKTVLIGRRNTPAVNSRHVTLFTEVSFRLFFCRKGTEQMMFQNQTAFP